MTIVFIDLELLENDTYYANVFNAINGPKLDSRLFQEILLLKYLEILRNLKKKKNLLNLIFVSDKKNTKSFGLKFDLLDNFDQSSFDYQKSLVFVNLNFVFDKNRIFFLI